MLQFWSDRLEQATAESQVRAAIFRKDSFKTEVYILLSVAQQIVTKAPPCLSSVSMQSYCNLLKKITCLFEMFASWFVTIPFESSESLLLS